MRSSSLNPNRKLKQVVYSRTYIPAGTTIENKQVEVRGTDELDIFDDAKVSLTEVVGTVLKRPIPANAQIRKVDLEAF
jgi:flagella basal body P-ring formation protein FlgA